MWMPSGIGLGLAGDQLPSQDPQRKDVAFQADTLVPEQFRRLITRRTDTFILDQIELFIMIPKAFGASEIGNFTNSFGSDENI